MNLSNQKPIDDDDDVNIKGGGDGEGGGGDGDGGGGDGDGGGCEGVNGFGDDDGLRDCSGVSDNAERRGR